MKKLNGVILVLISSILFGLMPIWVKSAFSTGMNVYDVCFIRTLIASFLLFIIIKLRKTSVAIRNDQVWVLLPAALIGFTLVVFALYSSYIYLSVGVATALHFVYPVVVLLLSILVYRERLGRVKWLAVLLSVLGVFCMTATGDNFSAQGILLALISAILYGVYIILIANPRIKQLDNLVVIFWVCVFSTLGFMLLMLFTGNWPVNLNPTGVYNAAMLAVLCTVVAMCFFVVGVKAIGPTSTAILSTLQPVVSVIVGILLLGEQITLPIAAGILLVLVAVVLANGKEAPANNSKNEEMPLAESIDTAV